MLDHENRESNPSRKRPRKNTTRACDSCKAKKTRCDGTLPCARCQTYNTDCTYDSPHSRKHQSPILLAQSPPIAKSDQGFRATEPHPSREITPDVTEGVLGLSSNLAFSHAARVEFTSRAASPANAQQAQGESVTLDPIGTRKGRPAAIVKHLHFSEPPFDPLNIVRYSLPTVENGLQMVSWYFDNASPTYRFLYRPQVEEMVQSLCQTNEWLQTSRDEISLNVGSECTVLMCWALGCQYPMPPRGRCFTAKEQEWIRQKGQTYYQVTDLVVNDKQNSLDTLSILHVKLLMCLYLLTTARLKAAWDLFAAVKHLANSLDLNRPAMFPGGRSKPLQNVLRARVFWAIYTLDTYLCAMLGKMLTFGERDIKVEHTIVDDVNLQSGNFERAADIGTHELSIMIGPSVHAKLAKIIRQTLRDLYLDYNGQYDVGVVQRLALQVKQWEVELPEVFRLSSIGALQPIYARQAGVIRLAMQHALILIYRPSLPLTSLACQWNSDEYASHPQRIPEHQDLCLEAAIVASEIVSSLSRKGGLNGAFWFSAYIAFCAGTVMLVYLGQNMRSLGSERRQDIWKAAQRCCDTERQLSSSNRLARRYVAALEKMLAEYLPQTLSEQLRKRLFSIEQPHNRPNLSEPRMDLYNPSFSQISGEQLHQDTPFESLYFFGNETSPSAATGDGVPFNDFFMDLHGPTAFFDFDSFVSGGANFGYP